MKKLATSTSEAGGASEVDGEAGWLQLRTAASHIADPPLLPEHWPFGLFHTRLPDMDAARRLFDPGSQAARRARSAVFYAEGSMARRSRLRIGMHDRGEEYTLADGCVHEADRLGHARHFPLHLQVVRLRRLNLGPGEAIDLSADRRFWPGLHPREELYTLVMVDRLDLGPSAVLTVRGTVAVLRFGRVTLAPGGTPPGLHILATPHPAFSRFRRQAAADGANGRAGTDGPPGRVPMVVAGIFGPVWVGGMASDGGDGLPGQSGEPGGQGQNGGLQMLADIRIGALEGCPSRALRILGQPGAGQPGGAGGHGGAGGRGGCAASDCKAGRPGAGGHGGPGGRGGAGGLGSNIFVSLPRRDLDALDLISLPAPGGAGGRGGRGGYGVPAGNPGPDGPRGRDRDGPPIWVFAEGETDTAPIRFTITRSQHKKDSLWH